MRGCHTCVSLCFRKRLFNTDSLTPNCLTVTASSASSSHTMTAASVKDPTSLAFRIMVDAKSELQKVEKLQQLSIQKNRMETNKLRLNFAEKLPNKVMPGDPPNKSPKPIIKGVHFDEEALRKPPVAPKPRPRVDIQPQSISSSLAKSPANNGNSPREVKEVRFSETAVAIDSTTNNHLNVVRPPPGYDNDSDKGMDTPSPRSPNGQMAPPPYDVAVSSRGLIKHSRQAEIQHLDSSSTNFGVTHRRQLSDSREQLVDSCDQEDYAYYENGGFDESEFQVHLATPISTVDSPVSKTQPVAGKGLKPAIKPYTKQNSVPYTSFMSSSLNKEKTVTAQRPTNNTDISQMDYVNIYENEHINDDRFVSDIHNHYVEDLYPESTNSPYLNRASHSLNSPSNNSWGYQSNNQPNSALFYVTEGLKSSEC